MRWRWPKTGFPGAFRGRRLPPGAWWRLNGERVGNGNGGTNGNGGRAAGGRWRAAMCWS
jgi:hypothetical protein